MAELILRRLRERRLPPIVLMPVGLASWVAVVLVVRLGLKLIG